MALKVAKIGRKSVIGTLPRSLTENYRTTLAHAFESFVSLLKPGTSAHFKAKYQTEQFLSKYSDPAPGDSASRSIKAVTKWLMVDSGNSRTNDRLLFDDATFTGDITTERLFSLARKYIMDVLGEAPPVNIVDFGEFSNGASTRVRRGPTAVSQKFVGKAHVTQDAFPLFQQFMLENEGYLELWTSLETSGFEFVQSSVMFTVPKNSEIDRVACKEPEINMFLQRAAGNYIRSRLMKKGVNLNDQSINQGLARRGSLPVNHPEYLPLSTIDLSSASDCVSESLVVSLVPPAWFVYLNDVRVKSTLVSRKLFPFPGQEPETTWQLNMFSSMGNGFTFELESLLFWALARAYCTAARIRGRISVYGDDIILPNDAAPRFARVLQWFGFKVNPKKSHWKGSFRESCGAHWYSGYDVTPFYLRGPLLTQPDLINQLNQLREWIVRDSFNGLWTYDLVNQRLRSSLIENYYSFAAFIWSQVRGGRDIEANHTLVTPSRPYKRFTSRVKQVRTNPMGAYLQWLQVRERVLDAVTSRVSAPEHLVLAPYASERELESKWFFLEELPGFNPDTSNGA